MSELPWLTWLVFSLKITLLTVPREQGGAGSEWKSYEAVGHSQSLSVMRSRSLVSGAHSLEGASNAHLPCCHTHICVLTTVLGPQALLHYWPSGILSWAFEVYPLEAHIVWFSRWGTRCFCSSVILLLLLPFLQGGFASYTSYLDHLYFVDSPFWS